MASGPGFLWGWSRTSPLPFSGPLGAPEPSGYRFLFIDPSRLLFHETPCDTSLWGGVAWFARLPETRACLFHFPSACLAQSERFSFGRVRNLSFSCHSGWQPGKKLQLARLPESKVTGGSISSVARSAQVVELTLRSPEIRPREPYSQGLSPSCCLLLSARWWEKPPHPHASNRLCPVTNRSHRPAWGLAGAVGRLIAASVPSCQ